MLPPAIKPASSEFEVFMTYFKLRMHFFMKEEALLIVGVLMITQLSYAVAILFQMNHGAQSIINDGISLFTLPLIWTIIASIIFSRERKEEQSLLSLTLPINPYHRFAVAALIAIFLVPLASFVLTRLLYAANLLLASFLIQRQNVPSEAYANLSASKFMLSLFIFPPTSLGQLWFLPTTFFFFAASIIRKHVFIKVSLILFVASLVLSFLALILLLMGVLIDFSMIVDFFMHMMRHLILYELILFALGFILLTLSYLFVRNFKIA